MSVRASRTFVTKQLVGWGVDADDSAAGRLNDITLVMSELAGNATKFCRTDIAISLVAHRDHIEVAVSDDNPARPACSALTRTRAVLVHGQLPGGLVAATNARVAQSATHRRSAPGPSARWWAARAASTRSPHATHRFARELGRNSCTFCLIPVRMTPSASSSPASIALAASLNCSKVACGGMGGKSGSV